VKVTVGGLHKGVSQRISNDWCIEQFEYDTPGTDFERNRRNFNRNDDVEGSGDGWGGLFVRIRFNSSSSVCLLECFICSLFNSFIRCETIERRFNSADINLFVRYSNSSSP